MIARTTILNLLAAPLAAALAAGCGGTSSSGDDTATPPDAAAIAPGVTAVPLRSIGGGYSAELRFGAQSFQAIVDTGSSSTAVASSACTCNVQPEYAVSTGAIDKGAPASSTYGDQSSWKGEVYEDMATIGDGPAVALDFAAIQSSKGFFRGGGFQGIIGLGPDSALLAHTTSYLTSAIQNGMTGQVAFQMCSNDGTMWLGGFDPAATADTPVFTPLKGGLPYYMIGVGGASIGGTDTGLTSADFGPAIVDTGTTITYVPTAVETKLIAAISASDGFKHAFGTQALADGACLGTSSSRADLDAMLPPLALTFPGTTTAISIPATRSYLFADGGGYCFTFSDSSQLAGGAKVSLLGNTLLGGMITVFDLTNKQVGFAAQRGCDGAAPDVAHPAVTFPSHAGPWWANNPRVRLPPAIRL